MDRGPGLEAEPPSHDYLVFGPAGRLLGTVEVPPVRVMENGDDYLLGYYLDELEVEYLHVYSIRITARRRDRPNTLLSGRNHEKHRSDFGHESA